MHWRKSTWALIAWTTLMVVWLCFAVSATAQGCTQTGGHPDDCSGYVGVAVGILVFIWAVVALPLSAFWYTRRGTRNGEVPPVGPSDGRHPPSR